MQLFEIISGEFFKPLSGKYKTTYIDCLELIYSAYKTELSFGVDKEVIINKLEMYFDDTSKEEMLFDDESEAAVDSRSKANSVLRTLKNCNWLEYEVGSDYNVKVNLFDYSATMIESFRKIIKDEEVEYQSVIYQIYSTLENENAYTKPYEYIIKRVDQNTEELINGLKKLNTTIKKRIDSLTRDMTAAQVVEDFFSYNEEVGSKAYHRMTTSDNISHFRLDIIGNLRKIIEDENIFKKSVDGLMVIEQIEDRFEAEELLRNKIQHMILSFNSYDEIIDEIRSKHTKYLGSAIARAKYLIGNTNNMEGKLNKILSFLSDEFNKEETLNLNDESDGILMDIFDIFPQNFIDNDSLRVEPITKKIDIPKTLDEPLGLSKEERELRKIALQERNAKRFSKKNINRYVGTALKEQKSILASTLPLENRRDLIQMVFISLYGHYDNSIYRVERLNERISVEGYSFSDFRIIRRDDRGNI